MLLHRTAFINDKQFESLMADCQELRKMMGATIKTAKKNRLAEH